MIYHSGKYTQDDFRRAQAILDEHVTLSGTGRCRQCGCAGPCPRRENAVVIFNRGLRLPSRRPGASLPQLINARCITGASRVH